MGRSTAEKGYFYTTPTGVQIVVINLIMMKARQKFRIRTEERYGDSPCPFERKLYKVDK